MTDYHEKDEAEARIERKRKDNEDAEVFGDLLKKSPEEREKIVKQIQETNERIRLYQGDKKGGK